jgi:hypothetical protein
LSVRDELATLITSHTVSWDQACLIADSILDLGWGSPDDMRCANEYGYDEGLEYAASKIAEYRKIHRDLRGLEPEDSDLQQARQSIDGGSALTYGRFEAWVAEEALDTVANDLDLEDNNPYRPQKH